MSLPPNLLGLTDEELPLFEMWERGTSISYAFYTLFPSEEARRYESMLPRANGPMFALNLLAEMTQQTKILGEAQRITPEEFQEFSDLEKRLKGHLLWQISSGELVAVGFVYPRSIDEGPRRVPLDLIRTGLDWKKDCARGQGLQIDDIRVFPQLWLEESVKSAPPERLPEPVISPRKGRPSKRDLILEAYQACLDAGSIDLAAPKKAALTTVNDWIELNRPEDYMNGRGLGNEVIRQTIADDLDKRRKFAKSKKQ